MLHTRDAISFRGRRVVHSAVLAVLTMAAMLLCVLAVHSAGHGLGQAPGHSMSAATATNPATTAATTAVATATATTAGAHSTNSAATHTASSGALLERLAPATATVAATETVTALAVGVISTGVISTGVISTGVISIADTHALSEGATLSMMCSLLLVLGALILLSRRPAAFRRLLEAGGFIVGSFREIPLHLRRPSLTLLSISRI